MPLSTADISIQLLMDTTAAVDEIQSRLQARAFPAILDPTRGPALRDRMERLLVLLDETSPVGVI